MQAKINDNTKIWKIPVTYSMAGMIEIKADTLKEAIDIALNDESIPLPDDAYYIDSSWGVCDSEEYIRECYNNNQEDNINE